MGYCSISVQWELRRMAEPVLATLPAEMIRENWKTLTQVCGGAGGQDERDESFQLVLAWRSFMRSFMFVRVSLRRSLSC